MNRQQRRAAAKDARRSARRKPVPGQVPADPALARAQALHGQGALKEAARLYRGILDRDPNRVEAMHFLGLIQMQLGEADAGAAALGQSADLRPERADFQNNHGVALMRFGRLDEAEARFRAALAQDPDYVDALFNLGGVLAGRRAWQEAEEVLARTVKLRPDHAAAWTTLGGVHEAAGHGPEAEAAWRKVLALDPGQSSAVSGLVRLLNAQGRGKAVVELCRSALKARTDDARLAGELGTALAAAGALEGAVEAFQQAIAVDPSLVPAHINLGLAWRGLGRQQEAVASLRRALALDPGSVPAYYNLTRARRMQGSDPEIQAMTDLLGQAERLSSAERVQLRFALAKAEEDTGRPDRAYPLLTAANAEHRKVVDYDADGTARVFNALKESFDRSRLEETRGTGAAGEAPVFVVGMPRSGTTLAEQILASHGEITGIGEPTILRDQARTLGARLGREPGFPACVAEMTADELAAEGSEYLDQTALAAGGTATRIVDKLPGNFRRLGWIAMTLPGARIVHCVRDPRDTCLSCFATLFEHGHGFAYDLGELGHYYGLYHDLMRHWATVLPTPIFELRYETLVAEPEATIRRLVDFLGLGWDPACLAFHEARRPVLTASAAQVRDPIHAGSVGRWRRFEDHLGPLVEALRSGGVALDADR